MLSHPSSSDFKKTIAREANQCVSCGLCLPACPTYRLLKSEADSPRGRIALMQGVATKRIPMNARFIEHMDRCLTCRACEAVCPNHVSYGQLIDQTRALLLEQPRSIKKPNQSRLKYLLQKTLLTRPDRLEKLRLLYHFAQKSGFWRWIHSFNRLKTNPLVNLLASLPVAQFPYTNEIKTLPFTARTWKEIYPINKNKRGEVALFLGCVARLTDIATLNASIYVLNRLGYTVHIPQKQTCCGALYQHSGHIKEVSLLNKQNKAAFESHHVDAIITTASGCGAQLAEHGLFDENHSIMDISQFLAASSGWEQIDIAPLSDKIIVHDPCTLRNVLQAQSYPYALMSRIPNAQIIALADNDQCCGAAGTYFLDQSNIANALLTHKLDDLVVHDAKYLVTSNVGCSMHITQGLWNENISVEVMHPVTLLARQMRLRQ